MSHAVDLPVGSIVANSHDCAIKRAPSAPYPWRTTDLAQRATDEAIEAWLEGGALVQRYGYEPNGRPEVAVIPTETAEREILGYPCGHRLVLPDALLDPS